MRTAKEFVFDLSYAMRQLPRSATNTEQDRANIASCVNKVLSEYYNNGTLLELYESKVETFIQNRDNLPMYQYEVPCRLEVFYFYPNGKPVERFLFAKDVDTTGVYDD